MTRSEETVSRSYRTRYESLIGPLMGTKFGPKLWVCWWCHYMDPNLKRVRTFLVFGLEESYHSASRKYAEKKNKHLCDYTLVPPGECLQYVSEAHERLMK